MIENLSPVGGTRRGNVETAFFPQIYVLISSAYYCLVEKFVYRIDQVYNSWTVKKICKI